MLDSPKGNDFVVVFNDNFLYEEVVERYKDYFNQKNFLFNSIIDYINATVIGVNFPGVKGDSSNTQNKGKEVTTYKHRSGINSRNKINKTLRVTFQLKRGFINWFILNDQLSIYNDGKTDSISNEDTGGNTFLPPITVFILDSDGHIIVERILKNIVLEGMDDLTLLKSDIRSGKKEFSVTFSYSEWNDKYNLSKRTDSTKKEYNY